MGDEKKPKVIQLMRGATNLYALCDDGQVYMRASDGKRYYWVQQMYPIVTEEEFVAKVEAQKAQKLAEKNIN